MMFVLFVDFHVMKAECCWCMQALCILKASLTSTAALTDALIYPMLKKIEHAASIAAALQSANNNNYVDDDDDDDYY